MSTMFSESDLEKGHLHKYESPEAEQHDSHGLNSSKRRGRSDLDIFQTLVGIHFLHEGGGRHDPKDVKRAMEEPPSPFRDIFTPSAVRHKRFRNRGLYDRALSQELKNRSLYTMSHYIISGLYLLQILLAATFTALSAYQRASNVALTVLGALNTVIAGVLAWLTGQGMPVRFRAARDQYRELVKAIEDAERTFAEIDYIVWPPEKRPDPFRERDRLEKLYKDALSDQQSNYPEAHNTPSADKKAEENTVLHEKVGKNKEEKRKYKEATARKIMEEAMSKDSSVPVVESSARKPAAKTSA